MVRIVLKRKAGVQANTRVTGHEGVVFEALIPVGIWNNQRLCAENGVGTERPVARRLLDIEPDAGFKPLAICIDKTQQCNGSPAGFRRDCGDVVVGLLWPGPEDPVFMERCQAFRLVLRTCSRFHNI